jgi:hypothetical protein
MSSRREPVPAVPPDPDLAATRELVEEVLLTAIAIEEVIRSTLAELPEGAIPEDEAAEVLLEMVVGSIRPATRAAGPTELRTATALVAAIRERVLADIHTAADRTRECECEREWESP